MIRVVLRELMNMPQYYDVTWVILVILNTFLRPQLFLFFSNTTTTSFSTTPPTTTLSLKTTLISLTLFVFLFHALKAGLSEAGTPGSISIRFWFTTRSGWSFFLFASSSIFSLISPPTVFLFTYPLIIILISLHPGSRLRHPDHHDSTSINEPSSSPMHIDEPSSFPSSPMHVENFYYELRWMVLLPINIVLRPELQLFFSDYTNTTITSYKLITIVLILLLFLFISPTICLTDNDTDSVSYILLRVRYRDGWAGLLLTSALILSLLCPTLVFLYYVYPVIILLSLWPAFFLATFRRFLLRLSAAVSAFLYAVDASSSSGEEQATTFEERHDADVDALV